ncbi:MAG: hypothetical protein EOO02_13535 [Chitinophagaceae bacterium]|nr:MAG: hypothetical protein EOO02_13535 [Chitinophagaceae bacterium]
MKLFTLRRILPAMLILLSFTASASDNAVKPLKVKFAHAPFVASIKTYETEYNKKYVLKVCACQMMTVQSNNEQIENIAVFSEKVNNGDLTADFAVATTESRL